MKKSGTILLVDNSPVTSVKLVALLQNTEVVNNVFYAKDIKKGCSMFSVTTIDVLILATQLVNEELVRLTELCKMLQCKLILLSENAQSSYKSYCKSIGIFHLLDKASEVNKVETILTQMLNN